MLTKNTGQLCEMVPPRILKDSESIIHNVYNARSLPVSPKIPMDAHSQCTYGVVGSVSTRTITPGCQSLMAHTPGVTSKDRPYYCNPEQGDFSLWHYGDSLHVISLCTYMMYIDDILFECDEYHRVISICVFPLTKLPTLTEMMGADKRRWQAYMCDIFDKSQRNKMDRAIWYEKPFHHRWLTAATFDVFEAWSLLHSPTTSDNVSIELGEIKSFLLNHSSSNIIRWEQ